MTEFRHGYFEIPKKLMHLGIEHLGLASSMVKLKEKGIEGELIDWKRLKRGVPWWLRLKRHVDMKF